jgi:hypothetical protein
LVLDSCGPDRDGNVLMFESAALKKKNEGLHAAKAINYT